MSNGKAVLLVRVSPELKTKLIELAKRERRSVSKQAELLLEGCFDSKHARDDANDKGLDVAGPARTRQSKRGG